MILDDIGRHGVVPVIALDDAAAALPPADALVGAGTVLTKARGDAAVAAVAAGRGAP